MNHMIILFAKAIVRGDMSTGALFGEQVDVAGYHTKDGTYVAPHRAVRQKKLVRPMPVQHDLFGAQPAPVKAAKPVDTRQADLFAQPAAKVEPAKPVAKPVADMPAADLHAEYHGFDSDKVSEDDYFDAMDRHVAVTDELAAKLGAEPGGLVLAQKRSNGSDMGAYISPEPDGTGRWRITWFDARGFSGDTQRKDKAACVLVALQDGYRDTNRQLLRTLMKQPSFQEGNEDTEKVRDANKKADEAKKVEPAAETEHEIWARKNKEIRTENRDHDAATDFALMVIADVRDGDPQTLPDIAEGLVSYAIDRKMDPGPMADEVAKQIGRSEFGTLCNMAGKLRSTVERAMMDWSKNHTDKADTDWRDAAIAAEPQYKPIKMTTAKPMFRSVSIQELKDIIESGKVKGKGNKFNPFDVRRHVFFADAISNHVIRQGEELQRQADVALADSPLTSAIVEAKARFDQRRAYWNAQTAPGSKATQKDRDQARIQDAKAKKAWEDAILAHGKAGSDIMKDLRKQREDGHYSSAIIETKPVDTGLHYSSDHGRSDMQVDEYGFQSGQIKADDITRVHLIKDGKVTKTVDVSDVDVGGVAGTDEFAKVKEGDHKFENNVEYVLKDGHWHLVSDGGKTESSAPFNDLSRRIIKLESEIEASEASARQKAVAETRRYTGGKGRGTSRWRVSDEEEYQKRLLPILAQIKPVNDGKRNKVESYRAQLQKLDGTAPAAPLAWGVPAGTTKTARRKLNSAALALLKAKADADMTDADKAILAQYTGRGGIGDSLNEFYTDPAVASAMWTMLGNLGFRGGDVLEPSCATGVFLHTAPAGSRVQGVEYDPTSARIGGILHRSSGHDVAASSLERFAMQDGRQFDAVIGNVPFGLRGSTIRDDKPDLATAEQYFFDAALDKTKDGGLVALIVPTGIMDSKTGRAFRERMLRKGEFLGARRLPNTAFEASHTGVTTDVVVFRKRPADVAGALSTVTQDQLKTLGVWDTDFLAGDYFTGRGAGDVMGRLEDGWRAKAGMGHDITVTGGMEGIPADLSAWTPAAPTSTMDMTVERVLAALGDDERAKAAAVSAAKKPAYQVAQLGDVRVIDGVRYVLQGEPPRWHRTEGEVPEVVDAAQKLGAMLDTLAAGGDPLIRAKVIEALNDFVATHGGPARNKELSKWLSSPSLPMLAGSDPESHQARVKDAQRAAARVLGAVNDDGSYSDLVTGRDRKLDDAALDTVATKLSLETGGFSPDQLSAAWGHGGRDEVLDHLFASPAYAVSPDGQTWETMDTYISGELWVKLDAAKVAAGHEGLAPEYKAKYEAQAKALEAAIDPQSLEDVEVLITSGFVTPEILTQWFTARRLAYQEENVGANWSPAAVKVEFKGGIYTLTGTERNWDADLIEKLLNRTGVRKDDLPKIERFNAEFREWLLASPLRDKVEETYNRTYRGYRAPAFSDAPIAIPGLNPALNVNGYHFAGLRWALESGKGIIAADVGLGKTGRGLMLAKLAKATGQAKKPTFVVPKSVLSNWMAEAEFWFPGSKCLVIGETYSKDKNGNIISKPDNEESRRRKYQDMQQNDYDFIFISQPAWNDLDVDPITKGQYANGDFWAQRGDKLGNAGNKRLNKIRTNYDQALAKRDFTKRENTTYFNDLGVDMLILDEGHAFKNLYAAKNRFGESPKFLGGSGLSNRAQDTYFKTRFLRESHDGKGVFMLTATPTKNSPLEVYSMLSHIAPDVFENMGIKNSEDFLDRFCEFKNDTILTTSGQLEEALVTAGFKNLNELRGVMKRYIDRKTAEDVGLKLPGRDDRQHMIEMTAEQEAVYQELREAAAAGSKSDDTGDAHIFSIMSKMGKASIDLSLLGAEHAGARSPKIEAAAKTIVSGAEDGGQVVFCDHVDTHETIAAALVKAGIPRNQIGIINGKAATTSAARQKISDDFNAGKLKVVIGNTATMGEGVNLQKGTTDIHHLDLPWEPASVQQRNGRGLRQGNKKESVRIHTYLAKGSFDGYRYQTIMSKKDWQDLLWNGGDRVENLAKEGGFSRTDMLIMLSANPEETKAKYDADKTAADQRKTADERGKMVAQYDKWQEMRASIKRMKASGIEGPSFQRARVRAKIIKESLRDNRYFTHKDLLDTDTPALIEPVTGHAWKVGSAFETEATKDSPINEAAKWVVTVVDRAAGTIAVRRYGGVGEKYPLSIKVADMKSGAVPFVYSDQAEAAEVAEKMTAAALTKAKTASSLSDLKGVPDSVLHANHDQYQSMIKDSIKSYRSKDHFSHMPVVDKAGNVKLLDYVSAINDNDLMLPTSENRSKALRAYADMESNKIVASHYQSSGKKYSTGKSYHQIEYDTGKSYGRPTHNPWRDYIKAMFGQDAVDEATKLYHADVHAAAHAADNFGEAVEKMRNVAPVANSQINGGKSTIHQVGINALIARAKAKGELAEATPELMRLAKEQGDLAAAAELVRAAADAGVMAPTTALKHHIDLTKQSTESGGYYSTSRTFHKYTPEVVTSMGKLVEKHNLGDMTPEKVGFNRSIDYHPILGTWDQMRAPMSAHVANLSAKAA